MFVSIKYDDGNAEQLCGGYDLDSDIVTIEKSGTCLSREANQAGTDTKASARAS